MTEKLKMEQNPLSVAVEKIKEICPAAVTSEGKIDFEYLKTALSDDVAADAIEKYEFTWVGKNAARVEANRPIRKTLRPVVADSKNWDTTKNLYIEGDNLDALKLLQESYLGKVKMIYIDPPYNTGNDFVYCDEFAAGCEEYLDKKGQCDSDGNRLFKNTETNGRFHSDWCSMMYPRLKIARDLLSDDGVIFVSISVKEFATLRKIMDEVFGEQNFLYHLSVVNKLNGNDNSSGMMETEEFCLIYAKSKDAFEMGVLPLDDQEEADEWERDEKGYWKLGGSLKATGINAPRAARPNLFFPIYINPHTLEWSLEPLAGIEDQYHLIPLTEGQEMSWYWSKSRFEKDRSEVIVKKVGNTYSLYKKQRPQLGDLPSKRGKTTFYNPSYSTANSNAEIKKLFENKKVFDYTKSMYLIKDFVSLANTKPDDIVLDFFSGSATTAHAVMQLNAEDSGNRRFIMVQLPEECDTDSEAFKAGYKNICEIGKERIRRAGEKIKSENLDKDIDVGFRVLRIDSTNMKDVYYKPSDTTQKTLLDSVDNIKSDRSDMDLLFGVMVDCGLPLDMPIETKTCDGKKYYVVNGGDYLVACFEPEISEKLVYEIANLKPTIAVFRDSSFADAKDKVNVSEIFKNITGRDDCVKVL